MDFNFPSLRCEWNINYHRGFGIDLASSPAVIYLGLCSNYQNLQSGRWKSSRQVRGPGPERGLRISPSGALLAGMHKWPPAGLPASRCVLPAPPNSTQDDWPPVPRPATRAPSASPPGLYPTSRDHLGYSGDPRHMFPPQVSRREAPRPPRPGNA